MNRIFPWETGRVDESDTNISFRKIKIKVEEKGGSVTKRRE